MDYTALQGRWRGTVRTWLEPDAPALIGEITGSFRSALGGATVIHDYDSSLGDSRSDGIMVIGRDIATNRHCLTWIDTFHTGGNVMLFAAEGDSFVGSYAGGDELWRWRVAFRFDGVDALTIEHRNITPDGEEHRAVEVEFRRRSDDE